MRPTARQIAEGSAVRVDRRPAMQKRRTFWGACFVPGTAALVLALLSPSPAGAQQAVPEGPEFQVNSFPGLFHDLPSVAMHANGDFVVAWSCDAPSGSDTGSLSIQAQRYASDGSAQGAQFQVNTYTTGNQLNASVAAAAGGDFVVIWESYGSVGTDTSYRSVQGQRYASDGSPQGAEFQVNTYTTQSQIHASVAASPTGDFVVVWDSNGSAGTDTAYRSIQGQRYASDGSPQGAEFQVNTYTTSYQRFPFVAADAGGAFVVAWHSFGSSGTDQDGYSVQGQRYASDGSAQGTEFQVNTYTTLFQRNASVAANADGDFVVVWESFGSYGTDASGFSVQGQRYASDGSAQGAEFQVNSYTTSDQGNPSVAVEADGHFEVVWQSLGSSGTDSSERSIQGQRYTSDGSPHSLQFQVNTFTTNHQYNTAGAAADEDFVVVWRTDGSPTMQTSGSSILAQRYWVPVAVPALSPSARFTLAAALLLLGCVLWRCDLRAGATG
jgi:hypothetical protein